MTELQLTDRLSSVAGKTGKLMESELGLRTIEDLLRHYPRRYIGRGQLTELSDLEVGEHVTVMARVSSAVNKPYTERRTGRSADRQEVIVTDGRGTLQLVFFKQAWRLHKELEVGRIGLFAGKITVFNGTRQLAHPEVQPLDDGGDAGTQALAFAGHAIPVYAATQKLNSWTISKTIDLVLSQLPEELPDPLPEALRVELDLLSLRDALLLIHRAPSMLDSEPARDRLRWDEAFLLQTVLAQRRRADSALPATPRVETDDGVLAEFSRRLPFTLTRGQVEVGGDITRDLAQPHPMHRLLQGEVGSGKTIVALRAMLTVVDAGGQAALLAPTEVLAQQHHRSITAMLGDLAERGMLGGTDLGTRVALVTGSMTAAQRRATLLDIGVGDAGIVIGTHALLEERVQFFDLGLVVVDEQHRFGVEQRAALVAKSRDGSRPHVLVMTATPIPRTVAMTVFGDLDTSTLSELPAGRSPIATHVVQVIQRPAFLQRAWDRIREEVAAGRQAYVVCPRIGDDIPDESTNFLEVLDDANKRRPAIAVLDLADELADGPLSGLRVAVLHGRMAPEDKDDVMRRFAAGPSAAGAIDVLVATTVIEVGVDVPNATVMVIMDAERFGMSQLHQLRGRVGRGGYAGLCLLVTEAFPDTPSMERLDAVASTLDGFELSRLDLRQRREGDVLGHHQSGRKSSVRLLQVLEDEDIIVSAREQATALVDQDPTLQTLPALARAVEGLADAERADFLDKS